MDWSESYARSAMLESQTVKQHAKGCIMSELPLTVGALALDTRAEKVGCVMEVCGPQVFLRPIGGGREWQVARDLVQPLTEGEQLRARVADANARSSRGLFPPPLPEPQPDCPECDWLDARRRAARASADASAETDARVLLRRHAAEAHARAQR
jgi:hypothetical protein